MRAAALLAAALCLLATHSALAEEQRVVVLMPRGLSSSPWPEGTQAVIAELAASHYQVIVESVATSDLRALLDALKSAANEADSAGAISVLREREAGIAYVWTRRDANVVQVQSDSTEGAINEGALALRVLELIRARSLTLPQDEVSEPEPRPSPPPKPKPLAPAAPPKPSRSHRAEVWLGAGPTFAAGAPAPLVDVTLRERFALFKPLALDAAASVSVAPIELDTSAGDVQLSARKLTLHLMAEPWRGAPFRVAFGAGGGAVWLAETARAASGFQSHSDDAYLAIASLRGSATLQSGDLSFVFAVEPGLLLPAASIRSSGSELAHVGSSWTSLTAGIGWSP